MANILGSIFKELKYGYPDKDIIFEPYRNNIDEYKTVSTNLVIEITENICLKFKLKIWETDTELIVYGIFPHKIVNTD